MAPEVREVHDGLVQAEAAESGSFLLPLWIGLIDGTVTFDYFLAAVRARRKLTYLTIDTTGACDLKCAGMCYYNPAISLRKPFISEAFLVEAIRESAHELSMRVLAFAGKEPFLNPDRLFSLMREAGSIPSREFLIGIVSNGRHVLRHAASILRANDDGCLDYLDVSIDTADAAQHDLFRGLAGTHSLAVDAIRWSNSALPNVRTTVVSVLRWDNQRGILDLIRDLAPINKFYQIQPIQPPPYSPIMPLPPGHLTRFIEELRDELAGPLVGAGVHVSIELLGIYLLEAVRAGLFTWSDLREDENSTLYVERDIGGNTLVITCELFPLQAWRLARITYTGAYLAHMHFLQAPDPDQYAVGHLGQEQISSLFDRALASSSHFAQIIDSRERHDCASRPCWANCFGGLNGAENAFLEKGRKLTEQPRLCTKGTEDFAILETGAHHASSAPRKS